MKIVRYRIERRTGYGIIEGDTVYAAHGSLSSGFRQGQILAPLADVKILPPVKPSKVLAIGRNYLEHAEELGNSLPPEPLLFIKAPTAVIGMGDPIVLPKDAGRIDYEAELVAIIGRKARNVSEAEALDMVFGFTCGNDVTARELQNKDGQWARAKSFDSFAPLGPAIITDIGPEGRRIQCRVNGRVVQDANTNDLIFKLPRLLSFVSRVMTLLPGDLLYTGTPSGIGPLSPGDVVEVEIEGVGVLRNPVVAEA